MITIELCELGEFNAMLDGKPIATCNSDYECPLVSDGGDIIVLSPYYSGDWQVFIVKESVNRSDFNVVDKSL